MSTQIKLRRGTAAAWASVNPPLASGELGIETDTHRAKFGPGDWNDLPYLTADTSPATTSAAGVVELATTSETTTGTDATRAVTPAGVKAAIDVEVSRATTAEATKVNSSTFTAHTGDTNNPHAVTKSQVGLGNVDNTSDASKPVSTAQATAIGAKKTDSMSTGKLLGRGTAGTGAIEEITLGTNLSLSGTTLNASGGGGSTLPARHYLLRPTGAIAETMSRMGATSVNTLAITSGALQFVAVGLVAGDVITSISFVAGTTNLGTGSNQWFSLWDASLNKLAVTSDDTSTAWTTSTPVKTLNLTTPYTVPSSGLYYLGCLVVATTTPTLTGIATSANWSVKVAPAVVGKDSVAHPGLTNPASCPSVATFDSAGTAIMPWAWVS